MTLSTRQHSPAFGSTRRAPALPSGTRLGACPPISSNPKDAPRRASGRASGRAEARPDRPLAPESRHAAIAPRHQPRGTPRKHIRHICAHAHTRTRITNAHTHAPRAVVQQTPDSRDTSFRNPPQRKLHVHDTQQPPQPASSRVADCLEARIGARMAPRSLRSTPRSPRGTPRDAVIAHRHAPMGHARFYRSGARSEARSKARLSRLSRLVFLVPGLK